MLLLLPVVTTIRSPTTTSRFGATVARPTLDDHRSTAPRERWTPKSSAATRVQLPGHGLLGGRDV